MPASLQEPVYLAKRRRRAVALCLSMGGAICFFILVQIAICAEKGSQHAALNDDWQAIVAVGADPFDDVPAVFEPKKRAGESRRDRLHALTLFSTGCVSRQNGNLPGALRQFQRAYQYDPNSQTIAEAVVETAEAVGRVAERNRYLYKLFELGGGNHIDLEELAFSAAMNGEVKRSLTIYERLLDLRKDAEKEPLDVVIRWRLAEVYYLAGEYKKAAECAAWVVDALKKPEKFGLDAELAGRLEAGSHLPVALFGEFFLLADRPERAAAMFEKANAAAPNEVLLAYQLARVDVRAKRYGQALEHVQLCLDNAGKFREDGPALYDLLAEILRGLGREDELIERLEKLYVDSPQNAALGYAIADCYRRQSQNERAEELYKGLLAKTPAAQGYAGLLEIYLSEKRVESLLALLASAVEKTASLEPFGDGADKVSGDKVLLDKLAESARKLKEGKSDAATGANAYLAVALLAFDAKRFELAGEFFEKALQAAAIPLEAGEIIMIWSGGLLAAERYAEAADVLQRGFKQKMLDETQPVPYYYLSNALAMCDKTEAALAAAGKAAELRADSPHFAAQQGWILYRAKRYDEAAELYQRLLDRFDGQYKNEDIRDTMRVVRLALAGIEAIRKNTLRAESLLEEVLDEFPDDISAHNDLGYLWADENRHLNRALRMTRKASAAEPENAAYRDSYGWALFRLGRLEEAAAELKKAAEQSDDEEVDRHLERVRRKMDVRGQRADDRG